MTAIITWGCEGTGYVVCDSMALYRGPSQTKTSSFGEAHTSDHGPVEESSIKICELPVPGFVGIVGDYWRATALLDTLTRETESEDLAAALTELQPMFSEGVPFSLIFVAANERHLYRVVFDSVAGVTAKQRGQSLPVMIHGGLPHTVSTWVKRGVVAIMCTGLATDLRQMAALAFIQSQGIHEHLPSHVVGGAFFSASTTTKLTSAWQDDILYVVLKDVPGQAASEIDGGFVRVGIWRRHGFVHTAIAPPRARLFIGPHSIGKTPEEWGACWASERRPDADAFRDPRYVALLSTSKRLVVVVAVAPGCPRPTITLPGPTEPQGALTLRGGITWELEQAVAPNEYRVVIVDERTNPLTAKSLTMPLD